jgi:hypothetical protein
MREKNKKGLAFTAEMCYNTFCRFDGAVVRWRLAF